MNPFPPLALDKYRTILWKFSRTFERSVSKKIEVINTKIIQMQRISGRAAPDINGIHSVGQCSKDKPENGKNRGKTPDILD
ncbi:MAG: hypothetical protein WCF90_01280 [Methanomicrobiales archaeon]